MRILFLCLMLIAASLHAEELSGPHAVIDKAAGELLVIVKDGKTYFDEDPDRYYQSIDSWADPLIDFPMFTRSVMGPFGTKQYYASLSDTAAKEQYKKDYQRFVTVFRQGLINTYGKGLLAFNGQKVEVIPPTDEEKALIAANESVDVVQKVAAADKIYTIRYKMRPNKDGQWLLRNMVIETVNVGQLYQNQFLAAMKENNNDFAKVIDTWVIEAQKIDQEVEKAETAAVPAS